MNFHCRNYFSNKSVLEINFLHYINIVSDSQTVEQTESRGQRSFELKRKIVVKYIGRKIWVQKWRWEDHEHQEADKSNNMSSGLTPWNE